MNLELSSMSMLNCFPVLFSTVLICKDLGRYSTESESFLKSPDIFVEISISGASDKLSSFPKTSYPI